MKIRLRLKCDGTRTETRFGLSAKRTSPFKSAGASVQSITVSRVVRISVNNAGYTVFRGSVRVLATHSVRQFPLHFPSLRHRVPSGFNWTLLVTSEGDDLLWCHHSFSSGRYKRLTVRPKMSTMTHFIMG